MRTIADVQNTLIVLVLFVFVFIGCFNVYNVNIMISQSIKCTHTHQSRFNAHHHRMHHAITCDCASQHSTTLKFTYVHDTRVHLHWCALAMQLWALCGEASDAESGTKRERIMVYKPQACPPISNHVARHLSRVLYLDVCVCVFDFAMCTQHLLVRELRWED